LNKLKRNDRFKASLIYHILTPECGVISVRFKDGFVGGLFLLSLLGWMLPAYAEEANQTQAQALIQLAQKAQAIAERFLQQALAQDLETPSASALINDGKRLLQEAQAAYSQNEYATAIAKATEAQSKFKEALISLTAANSTQQPETSANEKARGILVAIQRARERLGRLNDILTSTQGASNDQAIITIRNLLTDAEAALDQAEVVIRSNPPNAADAARFLAQAEGDLGRATAELKQFAHAANGKRGEGILKGLENQIRALQKQIDKAAAKGVQVDDVKAQLNQVQGLIDAARQKFASGDVAGATADIQQAKQLIHAIRQALAARHG